MGGHDLNPSLLEAVRLRLHREIVFTQSEKEVARRYATK
jgi:hypothetical protein